MLTDRERNALLLGAPDRRLPERRTLNAGHVSLVYENGDLRYICYGEREIIRRIYMALRGEAWLTVPAEISDVAIESGADSFYITYKAHYRNADKGINFSADFTLSGRPNGSVTFEFDGIAHSTFKRNRIGICVLHPAQDCAGKPVTVTHSSGSRASGTYPTTIKPDQPFFDIAALTEEVGPGVAAHIRFSGDVFEMEDQRNWSDASFKTYSTPQALPKPVEVPEGTHIKQSVTLTLGRSTVNLGEDAINSDSDARMVGMETAAPAFVLPAPVAVEISTAPIAPFNGFGFVLSPDKLPLPTPDQSALDNIRFSHLRLDVDIKDDWQNKISQALEVAASQEVPLLVGLKNAATLTELPSLPALRSGDAFLVLSSSGEGLTGDLSRWRSALGNGVLLAAGSNNNFTELNRNRPDTGSIDALVYSVTPQVHSFDETSIMETPPMLAEQLLTAPTFAGGKSIFLGPLTLYRPAKVPAPQQKGILGAAWYVAALAYAAQGGASQVTLCDISGDQGILSTEGAAYPLYHALSAVGTSTGGGVQPVTISDPLQVACLSVLAEGGDWQDIFLVNLQPRNVAVTLSGVQGVSARVRSLDETTGGRFSAVNAVPVRENTLSLTLLPYAVVQIISGAQVK